MKLLGVDYGARRTGVAISDDGGVIAFPYDTLDTSVSLPQVLNALAKEKGVGKIVIGDGRSGSERSNAIESLILNFKQELESVCGVPVELADEAFSSYEAHGRQGKEAKSARKTKVKATANVDAKAAAVILQRYIDAKRKMYGK